jgi:two-component system sensor histidine kinase CpxA
MTRLFWKLFAALWLSIMGFSLVMAWVNAELAQQFLPDPPEQAARRGAQKVELILDQALRRDDLPAARAVLDGLPRLLRGHVFVLDPQGRELLGRDAEVRHLEARKVHHQRRELRDSQGRVYTLLVLRRPPPPMLESGWRGILHRLLLTGLASALVSWFVARYLARPLERLSRVSRELAAGDLGARIGAPLTDRGDEFGQVARDLDAMAQGLEASQQANRRLLRDVSHELRSPLARLQVALEIARNRDEGRVGAELDRIGRESERLDTLVGEVLGLLRDGSGSVPLHSETFDLSELLQDLCQVVSYEVPADQPAVQLHAVHPLPMSADRELLWRAFENLVRNAVLHAGQGGVSVHAVTMADPDWLEVRVEDHGPGIPPDQLARVFEPFYRVQEARDRQSGGHGLGLAIAATAVRRHRGRIEASNRAEGGLCVRVQLPRQS